MKHVARIEDITNPYRTSIWPSGQPGCGNEEYTVTQGFRT
jgi:hypothetical protein